MKLYLLRNTVSILGLIISLHIVSFSKIKLPIEVIGQEGKVVTRNFSLNQSKLNKAELVWMQVNNLSYQNKASVKINNGAWLPLNHATVSMNTPEKARGGMVHGGFNTIRFNIPATNLKLGENTISFRFNQSDGISIGYRVINFNLFDASRKFLLPNSEFTRDNPNNWVGPYTDAQRINEGKNLWNTANLKSNYLPAGRQGNWYSAKLPANVTIKAKCADCHAQDGRDLEIFSYSNESIIERAKFHNLTAEQGKKIASYIRSLSGKIAKVGRYGRPWNPPYQPGPSLKNVPIERWAAGAGLNAVLQNDKDMLSHMFPNGVNQEEVYKYFDSNKNHDRTVQPLAIQLPDWKHWLPIIHPKDAYTKNDYWNRGDIEYSPKRAYTELRNYLKAMPPVNRNKEDLLWKMNSLGRAYRFYLAEGSANLLSHWRTPDGNATKNLANGVSRELAATSLARLNAVKNFELMNEFNLEDKAHWFVKPVDNPQKRQWAGSNNQVFTVPAHFQACVGNNCSQFEGQSTATGFYETTAWYHLQLIVNGGDGVKRTGIMAVDWNYHPSFILKANRSSGISEPLRYYHSLNAMYQIRSWSGGNSNDNTGFRMRNQAPYAFIGMNDKNGLEGYEANEFPRLLNEIQPGLTKWVLNAQLKQFLVEMRKPKNSLANWNRVNTLQGGNVELERISKSTNDIRDVTTFLEHNNHADKMYFSIPLLKANGVDQNHITELIDWCKRAWPNINWDQINTTTPTYQLRKRNAQNFAMDGGNGGINGRQIYLWDQNINNTNQNWIEISRGAGYFSYKKKGTDFCIDGGNGGVNGQAVVLYGCANNNQNQHWKKIKITGDVYRLEKRNSPGFSIDGGNGGSTGQQLKLWASNNNNQNQHWVFNGASASPASKAVITFINDISNDGISNNDISIYPNIAVDHININGLGEDSYRVIVYDQSGNNLITDEVTSSTASEISVEHLSNGMYYVLVKGNDGTEKVLKLIKRDEFF